MTSLERLLAIMDRLRDPANGCEWDRAQDFRSIAPYTIEEAYEVADAIERDDVDELRLELGDLLLQVVFLAQIAKEHGLFDFNDVASAISDKMEARHPHIFAGAKDGMDAQKWERIKASERAAKGQTGILEGVARALPALMRANKIQSRAARVGFDWPDAEGPAIKLREELEELAEAPEGSREEEAGDLLFAAVNVVRAYAIDSETALRKACDKFERRFASMERLAEGRFASLSAERQEGLWEAVKLDERRGQSSPKRP